MVAVNTTEVSNIKTMDELNTRSHRHDVISRLMYGTSKTWIQGTVSYRVNKNVVGCFGCFQSHNQPPISSAPDDDGTRNRMHLLNINVVSP